jgi:putative salt-induced outer membrane protein
MGLQNKTLPFAVLLASVLAVPAVAQQSAVFTNVDAADDAVDDLEDDIQDEFADARDSRKFGNGTGARGWYGSVSATANGTSGNSDTADLGVGARFGYGDGVNGHDFILSYNYSEDDDESTANSLAAAYDYTRMFSRDFYGYGKIRTTYDEFSSYETDSFIGLGVGYRVVNTHDMTWSLQAGPGWRYAEVADETLADDIDEVAGSFASKFYYELGNGMFLTNDTDIITSDADTSVTNDLGFNVSISGPLAMRTSLLTEYHSDPLDGYKKTDNTLGVSLVYSFK